MTDTISTADLEAAVEAAWEARTELTPATQGLPRHAVEAALDLLDEGKLRVAEKIDGTWITHQWLKKAVLLSFRLNDNRPMHHGYDKVPLKWEGWGENQFKDAGFRAVPGSIVRRGAFIARNTVLMPSFVNIGAYVDEGTMVDTWTTVGSCAQIGKNVHLSGGVGIGGVLEPLQANPTIIEDNCFIGARSEVAEGVIVERGRGPGHGRLPVGLHPHRRPRHRRGLPRPRAGLFGRGARRHALGEGRPQPGLRRHRQTRRRPDPRQDRRQRTPAGVALSFSLWEKVARSAG
jgi:2,3,4,5-tetrahydropyridine-2,6-dicarboxylate N-succinyltransferase